MQNAAPYFDLVRGALGDLVDGKHFFDIITDDIITDDIIYEVLYDVPGWPRVIKGRTDLMAAFRGYVDNIALRSANELILHKTDDGRVAVIEYEVYGTVVANGAKYDDRFCPIINRKPEGRALARLYGLARSLERPDREAVTPNRFWHKAVSGHADAFSQCPFLGEKQTSRFQSIIYLDVLPQHKRPPTANLTSPIGHPRPSPSARKRFRAVKCQDVARRCGSVFGIGCRKPNRRSGKLGSRQDCASTLRISQRDLPQVAAKRFQNEIVFRARELPTRALHLQF
jgi:uncharacterized protein